MTSHDVHNYAKHTSISNPGMAAIVQVDVSNHPGPGEWPGTQPSLREPVLPDLQPPEHLSKGSADLHTVPLISLTGTQDASMMV